MLGLGIFAVLAGVNVAPASELLAKLFPSSTYAERLLIGRRAQLGDELVYRPGVIGGSSVDGALTYGEFDLQFFAELMECAMAGRSAGRTLVDVGSGCGRLVLASAVLWPDLACCAGVERVPELHRLAVDAADRAALSAPRCRFFCGDAADELAPGGELAGADLVFAYCSAFASEGLMLSDFSAVCGRCLQVGTRVVTTDKQLASVEGLWKFELLHSIEGPNVETGGQSVGYVHEVTQVMQASEG